MLAVGASTRLGRRTFLQAGALGLGTLTWPQLLAGRAAAGAGQRASVRSVIQLFMWGGPSQLETFDLKPNAPSGIRGQFQPIATATTGTRICKHLPRLAQRTPRYTIVRSLT